MPRFSDLEKTQIKEKLIAEGERLFAAHGLKKVTIDDIVTAVNIAKATFYTFYESKECLYLDIVTSIQRNIFTKLDALLTANQHLPSRQRVHQVFAVMYQEMSHYPILAQIDPATTALISRKVSKEHLETYTSQNVDAVSTLLRHNIALTCSPEIAFHAFQAIYHGWLSLHSESQEIQEAVTAILLNGAITQMIRE